MIARIRLTVRSLPGPVLLATGAVLVLIFVLLFGLNMRRGLNHDEHQFVGSAVLLAREGLLPYADFAYFHVPVQTWLNAALFGMSDHFLLTARLAAIFWAWLSLCLLLLIGLSIAPFTHAWSRLAYATAGVTVLLASPIFVHTSGRAWNHDLPMLLTLMGFVSFLNAIWTTQPQKIDKRTHDTPPTPTAAIRSLPPQSASLPRTAALWMLAAGVLLGLAAATRLSFAFLALAFALVIWLPSGRAWRRNMWLTLWLAAGGIVGMLPVWIALVMAPEGFLFGNITYNLQLNTRYYAAAGDSAAMTLGGKITYVADLLVAKPGNLVAPLLFVMALIPAAPHLRRRDALPLITVLVILPCALLGAMSATPSQLQYYYMLYPFLLLGFFFATALWTKRQLVALGAVVAGALLAVVATAVAYAEGMEVVLQPDRWHPEKVHRRGALIADLMGDGRVLTLAPIHAMEGGVPTYPEFVTGPLAWRVAHLVPAEERARQHLVGDVEMPALLAQQPPRAVLAGFEEDDQALEQILLDYAEENGFVPVTLPDEGVLWLAPLADWEGAIRLGAVKLPAAPVEPGASVPAIFYLANSAPIDRNLNVLVRVVGVDGREIARSEGWPYGSATETWAEGEMWPDGHQLALAPDAPPGIYRVDLSFYDPATLAIFGDVATVGYLAVADDVTQPDGKPLATFGGEIALLEVRTEAASWPTGDQAGQQVVTLTWQPAARLDSSYTVFVQLFGPDGQMVAQRDQPPLQGFYPTDRWLAGQPFEDDYPLLLPEGLTAGEYRLVVGWYDPATGERLPVVRGDASTGDAFDAALLRVE